MARKRRDTKAEYAQRKARAAELGTTVNGLRKMGARARERLREQGGQGANAAKQRAAEKRAAEVRAEQEEADNLDDGASSRYMTVIRRAVERAARNDRYLSAIVTVYVDDGKKGPLRTKPLVDVKLWQDGGWAASQFLANVRALGTRGAFLDQVRKAMSTLKYPFKVLGIAHIDLTAFE